MESSRAETLLKGVRIDHENANVESIKKVDNNIRQITLDNGKKIHVSKTRLKSIVDVTLRAQALRKGTPAASTGALFAAMYARRR